MRRRHALMLLCVLVLLGAAVGQQWIPTSDEGMHWQPSSARSYVTSQDGAIHSQGMGGGSSSTAEEQQINQWRAQLQAQQQEHLLAARTRMAQQLQQQQQQQQQHNAALSPSTPNPYAEHEIQTRAPTTRPITFGDIKQRLVPSDQMILEQEQQQQQQRQVPGMNEVLDDQQVQQPQHAPWPDPFAAPNTRARNPAFGVPVRDVPREAKPVREEAPVTKDEPWPDPFAGPNERLGQKVGKAKDPEWRTHCQERCDERTMDITGIGLHSIPSDKAEVRATVEVREMVNTTLTGGNLAAEDMRDLIAGVQEQVTAQASAVVTWLQTDTNVSRHITQLRTSAISLEPLYEYRDGRQFLVGYRASNSIAFRVDVAMAGMVIDNIVRRGITRIDGVTFVASPRVLNAARQTAISLAVEDCFDQALSALSGLAPYTVQTHRDLQIIRMDIQGVTRPEPTNRYKGMSDASMPVAAPMFARAEMASYSPVEGDDKTIAATVSMKLRF